MTQQCTEAAQAQQIIIRFFVPGIPRPGGSKKGFYNPKLGRVLMTKAGGEKEENWRQSVSAAAMEAMNFREPLRGGLWVSYTFVMPRPKYHYGKKGLKPDAPHAHTHTPDRGKLLRSTEDAMKGIVFADDSQVWAGPLEKVYGERPGCHIEIRVTEAAEETGKAPSTACGELLFGEEGKAQ